MGDLSPHFSRNEAACPCCGRLVVVPALVQLAERVRAAHYPKGLTPRSWFRCPARNKAVGGAKDSRHLRGEALDVPPVMTEAQARACGARGVGVDDATGLVLHVDVGPVRSWRYGIDGRVIT